MFLLLHAASKCICILIAQGSNVLIDFIIEIVVNAELFENLVASFEFVSSSM